MNFWCFLATPAFLRHIQFAANEADVQVEHLLQRETFFLHSDHELSLKDTKSVFIRFSSLIENPMQR